MEEKPKRLIARFVEFAVMLAVGMFLIRLAVRWLMEIWWIILIVLVIVPVAVIGIRLARNRGTW